MLNVVYPQADKHHSVLVDLIAKDLGVERENIMDFELCLADCNDAVSIIHSTFRASQ